MNNNLRRKTARREITARNANAATCQRCMDDDVDLVAAILLLLLFGIG